MYKTKQLPINNILIFDILYIINIKELIYLYNSEIN